MVYLHPLLGVLAALFFTWIGFRGLGARRRGNDAPVARATHRRLAPWAFALIATAAVGGTGSVLLLRDDLEPADSTHFWTGWSATVLGAGLWLSSRRLQGAAKTLHPLLGLLGMAVALLTALLGIRMLP